MIYFIDHNNESILLQISDGTFFDKGNGGRRLCG